MFYSVFCYRFIALLVYGYIISPRPGSRLFTGISSYWITVALLAYTMPESAKQSVIICLFAGSIWFNLVQFIILFLTFINPFVEACSSDCFCSSEFGVRYGTVSRISPLSKFGGCAVCRSGVLLQIPLRGYA